MNLEKTIVLNAKNLHKAFYNPVKITILDGIDLTVCKGESVAIMGRSGEGKTTLLQILGTLEHACSGSLEISGKLVTSSNKNHIRNQNIAFVFQSFHLLEDYTAIENVLMPARIARINTSKGSPAYQRGCDLLNQVGLAERSHFHTKLMSGGEKQRVAICRALFNDPDIIFADEPSGNLDKQTSLIIHQLLLNFTKEQNKSLVVVTHDQELAFRCDTQYQLSQGVLKPVSTTSQAL